MFIGEITKIQGDIKNVVIIEKGDLETLTLRRRISSSFKRYFANNIQLGARYILKAVSNKNLFLCQLIREYIRSMSAITARGHTMSTPLFYIASLIALSFACIVFIRMYVFCFIVELFCTKLNMK